MKAHNYLTLLNSLMILMAIFWIYLAHVTILNMTDITAQMVKLDKSQTEVLLLHDKDIQTIANNQENIYEAISVFNR